MTFKVTTRGAGAWLLCEFRCPTHGVFDATVQRDANGDAPDEQPCPESECDPECSPDDPVPCHRNCGVTCGRASPWTISSPKPKVLSVPAYAAVRGGDMSKEERKERGILDQRPLAEGKVTLTEWKKEQREETKRRRHAQLIDKGVIQRKVQV